MPRQGVSLSWAYWKCSTDEAGTFLSVVDVLGPAIVKLYSHSLGL